MSRMANDSVRNAPQLWMVLMAIAIESYANAQDSSGAPAATDIKHKSNIGQHIPRQQTGADRKSEKSASVASSLPASGQFAGSVQNTRPFGKLSLSLSLTLSAPVIVPTHSEIKLNEAQAGAPIKQDKTLIELNAEIAAVEEQIKARQKLLDAPGPPPQILASPVPLSQHPTQDSAPALATNAVDPLQDVAKVAGGGANPEVNKENPRPKVSAPTVRPASTKENSSIELPGMDEMKWAIAVFALLLAAAGWLWYRQRKAIDTVEPYDIQAGIETPKGSESPPRRDIVVESDRATEPEIEIPAWAGTPQQQKSLLPPEYEMLEEADIYLRFGHDKLAEEALREAIKVNPKNPQAYLTLLRIYFSREDSASFQTLARQLKALGDKNVWSRAVEMGRNLDADNPLYS